MVALFGGSALRTLVTAFMANALSTVGGKRNDNLSSVNGRKTFPPSLIEGIPPAPTIDKVGFQVRPIRLFTLLVTIGDVSLCQGKDSIFPLRASTIFSASNIRCSGTLQFSSDSLISPDISFSNLEISWRINRNDEGTTPLALPECTPSFNTSTLRLHEIIPRSDTVVQN